MRLLTFSDLHVDHNSAALKADLIEHIAAYIRETAPDLVIVAGDMAGGSERCIRAIDAIEKATGIPLAYIPGNHSVWTINKETDSWHEYKQLRAHRSSLIDRPILLPDDWVLIGDMGWYDYSFETERTREQVIKDRNLMWRDSVLARFGQDDDELCGRMVDKFAALLDRYRDKKIIFVNHFIPYLDYAPVSTHNKVWNMIRPFMGSSRIGDLLDASPQVRHVIFGHVHYRYGTRMRGDQQVICNPLGYVKEWRTQDPVTEIKNSASWIEI